MSAISGFCEKCNKFRKRRCDGNKNTCMTILFDKIEILQDENKVFKNCYDTAKTTIEALQQENERLADETIKLMKENAKNSNKNDELVKVVKQAREAIQRAKENFEPYGEYEYDVRYDLEEALAEIDKAIGGKAHE